MNAFNKQVLDADPDGLLESCDACNRLIANWDTVGDMAHLCADGVTIICNHCLHQLQAVVESPV